VSLPPGTYCYRNLTVQGTGTLTTTGTGMVTIYLTGSLTTRGDSTVGYAPDPRQMVFLGSSTAAVDLGFHAGTTQFYGGIYAPNSTLNVSGDARIFGSLIGRTVNVNGNAEIHFDEAMTELTNVANVYQRTVLSWRDLGS
jgi:hypothetical protein